MGPGLKNPSASGISTESPRGYSDLQVIPDEGVLFVRLEAAAADDVARDDIVAAFSPQLDGCLHGLLCTPVYNGAVADPAAGDILEPDAPVAGIQHLAAGDCDVPASGYLDGSPPLSFSLEAVFDDGRAESDSIAIGDSDAVVPGRTRS